MLYMQLLDETVPVRPPSKSHEFSLYLCLKPELLQNLDFVVWVDLVK